MKKILSHLLFFFLWSIICAPVIILASLHHVGHHESSSQNCVEHCISQIDTRTETSIPLLQTLKKIFSGVVPLFFTGQEIFFALFFLLLGNIFLKKYLSHQRKDYASLIGIIKSST